MGLEPQVTDISHADPLEMPGMILFMPPSAATQPLRSTCKRSIAVKNSLAEQLPCYWRIQSSLKELNALTWPHMSFAAFTSHVSIEWHADDMKQPISSRAH